MSTRDITIALELAIAIFAIYLLARRLVRLQRRDRQLPPFYVADIPENARLEADTYIAVAWFQQYELAQEWVEKLCEQGVEATLSDRPPQIKVRAEDARRAIEILSHS
jgi:hypothetical protein